MRSDDPPRRGIARRLLPYLPFALISLVMAPVVWPERPDVGDDYVLWSAGHIIATGGSPYDVAAWRPVQAGTPGIWNVLTDTRPDDLELLWLYPPWTAAVWAPFGALPKELGVPLIHLFLAGCTVAAVLLLVRGLGLREPWTVALVLAIGASFMPLVLASKVGHFSALLLLGVSLFARGLERSGPITALVAGALVLSMKPHLFVGFAVVVALGVLFRRGPTWRPLAAATAAILLVAVAGFVRYPLPIEQFARAASLKTSFQVATTAQLLRDLGAGATVATVVSVGLAVVVAAAIVRLAPRAAPRSGEWPLIAGGLLVSLIVSPYVQYWDQALLLPALAASVAVTAAAPRTTRIAILGGVVAVSTYAWVAFFAGHVVNSQSLSALTPLLASAVLLGALVLAREPIASRRAPAR